MSITLATLKTRLSNRGFDYLTPEVQAEFISDAYLEVAELEDWPWLEATTSGTAPLTISDLRSIESVRDSTALNPLRPLQRHNIFQDIDSDLTTAGTASYYYVTGGDTLNTYPANTTNTLAVNYWKVPTALTSDSDTLLIPDRFADVVLYGARAAAYWDSDNADMANVMVARQEKRIDQMRDSLLDFQHDAPDNFVLVLNAEDG